MKVESKSSSALRKEAQREVARGKAPRGRPRLFLPVVEQDVRSPDLVRGETEVLHPGMLALVPLEVVVEPALRHTHTFFMFTWASFTPNAAQSLYLHSEQQITTRRLGVLTIRSQMLVVRIWFFSSCKTLENTLEKAAVVFYFSVHTDK